ncbi:MAG: hypothetical protein U5K54_03635 [Cytophagales bacterium]|nr:hypothetical protein [Cytophagales bacterium]
MADMHNQTPIPYDNRLYVYEKDVWLAFTFPAYYGVGVRNYLLVQYAFTKDLGRLAAMGPRPLYRSRHDWIGRRNH